ncbi:MAG: hypothetical protein O3C43_00265 [Verrucomicrobia bacterium]|nr:hypothetical protein [Verrucomicrobiota bacterium]MDA1064912.1 hypothetical protein [Verrucomicrobiota bacterium]
MNCFFKYILRSVFLTGCLGVISLNANPVRIVGSNFAGNAMGEAPNSEEKMGTHSFHYHMTGSLIGLIKLQENFADVAFVLQTAEGYPAMEGLTTIPLGFWGVYFAVQEENPLNEVPTSKLSDILQRTKDGLKSEWGSLLPEHPKWANRLIFVSFDIRGTDPSYPILLNRFFENENPQNFSSLGDQLDNPYLAGASNLVVMSRLPEPGRGLRALSLIEDNQNVGFPPSGENLFFGDYSLKTTLYLVVRDSSDPGVRAFVRDFFEKNRVNSLRIAGLIDVPQNIQKQVLLEFDLDF